MASSGQILDILSKLEKGAKEIDAKERRARRAEGKQHRKLFSEANKRIKKASDKAKKGNKWGTILSTLLALTGVGIPAIMAAQFAGSLVGGKVMSDKAKKGFDMTGLGKTKFGEDLRTFKSELGSDVFSNALNRAMVTGLTAGVGSKVGGVLEKGADAWKIPGLELPKATLNPATKELLNKPVFQALGKGVKGVMGLPKTLHEATKLSGMGTGESALTKLLESYVAADKLNKMPSIYDYDLPSSMATPEDRRGFGGYI